MKRVYFILIILIAFLETTAQDKVDFLRTKVDGNRNIVDARLRLSHSLNIPKGASWSLNGAKDSIGYVMFNTTLQRFGVYHGSGVWKAYATIDEIELILDGKVDTIHGKGLSTEDYTSAEKSKLAGIAAGAEVNVNADWSAVSGDAMILNKPTFVATESDPVFLGQKGAINGVATLNSSGKIPNAQIPALALVDTYVAASQAAMLALSSAEQGDVAIRTDLSKTFILTDNNYSTLASWKELLSPVIPAETDPIWGASPSAGITGTDISNWNSKQNALSGTGVLSFSGTTPSYNTTSSSIRGLISDESGTGAMLFQGGNIGTATGTSLNLSDVLKFSASSTSLAVGELGYNSIYGQYQVGKAGITNDWTVFTTSGGYLMHNPTGTNKVAFASLISGTTQMVVANSAGELGIQTIPTVGGGGSVANIAIASANGLSGSSDGHSTSPTLTLGTTITGMAKGGSGAFSAATDGTDYLSPVTSVSTSSTIATWTQSNTTNGFGMKILSQGTATDRYIFSLQNLAETQTYLHVLTESGKAGSVVVGSKIPYTGLSSRGFTVNGTTYGSIGLNLNDINKGYLSSYADGLLLQSVGKMVINNNTGNVIIGTTTDDGSNKFQLTGNAAITGNITASNLGTASGYTATSTNTPLTVPLRDNSGNFSAGTITASLAGNASTATNVAWTGVTGRPTALSQFTNDLGNYGGWITGINSSMVTTALGYTPANSIYTTSGVSTPTISGITNVSSSTAYDQHYIRVGNEVTVKGKFLLSPTANGLTVVRISFPTSPDPTDGTDSAVGSASGIGIAHGNINMHVGSSSAELSMNATTTISNEVYYQFTYTAL